MCAGDATSLRYSDGDKRLSLSEEMLTMRWRMAFLSALAAFQCLAPSSLVAAEATELFGELDLTRPDLKDVAALAGKGETASSNTPAASVSST